MILAACGGTSPAAPAATPRANAPAETGEAVPLLAGHLTVRLPEGARVSARPHSIMSAEAADADETRIILEDGGEIARFVLLATELYRTTTGEVVADAKVLAAEGERTGALQGAGGLRLATLEPSTPPPADRPVFVLGVVVAHPDGTLQELDFFILPEMIGDLASYTERARAIARTVASGARRLAAPGGDARLGADLVVALPRGYLVATQPGPDFEVHRIRKLTRIDAPASFLGIYVGGHPSLQHRQSADEGPLPSTQEEAGELAGRQTTWVSWSTPAGTRVKEAIAELGEHQFVHAYTFSANEIAEEELFGIARSLRTSR
jgi:hypothetical protein